MSKEQPQINVKPPTTDSFSSPMLQNTSDSKHILDLTPNNSQINWNHDTFMLNQELILKTYATGHKQEVALLIHSQKKHN